MPYTQCYTYTDRAVQSAPRGPPLRQFSAVEPEPVVPDRGDGSLCCRVLAVLRYLEP
jgi:hypothetical protein